MQGSISQNTLQIQTTESGEATAPSLSAKDEQFSIETNGQSSKTEETPIFERKQSENNDQVNLFI